MQLLHKWLLKIIEQEYGWLNIFTNMCIIIASHVKEDKLPFMPTDGAPDATAASAYSI